MLDHVLGTSDPQFNKFYQSINHFVLLHANARSQEGSLKSIYKFMTNPVCRQTDKVLNRTLPHRPTSKSAVKWQICLSNQELRVKLL